MLLHKTKEEYGGDKRFGPTYKEEVPVHPNVRAFPYVRNKVWEIFNVSGKEFLRL